MHKNTADLAAFYDSSAISRNNVGINRLYILPLLKRFQPKLVHQTEVNWKPSLTHISLVTLVHHYQEAILVTQQNLATDKMDTSSKPSLLRGISPFKGPRYKQDLY